MFRRLLVCASAGRGDGGIVGGDVLEWKVVEIGGQFGAGGVSAEYAVLCCAVLFRYVR